MFATLAMFFLVGPTVGLCCFFGGLCRFEPKDFKTRKKSIWTFIAVECVVMVLASPLLGYAALLSSLLTLLALAGSFAFTEDPDFRALVSEAFGVAIKTRFSAKDKQSESNQAQSQTASGSADSCVPAPAKSVVFGGKGHELGTAQGDRCSPRLFVARPTDEQLLRSLLLQVQTLQTWTLRTDQDRQAIAALTSDTDSTEKALRAAVEQVENGSVDWTEVAGHVNGLKRHELPSDIAAALDKLVEERAEAIAQGKMQVGDLAAKLSKHREALVEAVSKEQLSPEDVIVSADNALADAAELNCSENKQ